MGVNKVYFLVAACCMLTAACQKPVNDAEAIRALHEEGRQVFYSTIVTEAENRNTDSVLTPAEMEKLRALSETHERLYEHLINIFYQKEEPEFLRLLSESGDDAIEAFHEKYIGLARASAQHFVTAMFSGVPATVYLRENTEEYKDLDTVDLVIRGTGYHAKIDPAVPVEKELDPGFETQEALDVGRFREAHRISKGKGVKIALLDTGIDTTHPVFGNTKWGTNFSLVRREGIPWESEASVVDWAWHGTMVSSIAAVYAPEAQLTVYKNMDGNTMNGPPYIYMLQSMMAAAIYKAVNDGNDVISISAGGATLDVPYQREAIEYAHRNNVVVVSSNPYTDWYSHGFADKGSYPEEYENVISVTAVEKKEDGTYGYWPRAAAFPGTDVAAANDIFGAYSTYTDMTDEYVPSTSAATPAVASLAAMAMSVFPKTGDEAPGEYADLITELILDNASPEKVGFSDWSEECGFGMIDAVKTVNEAVRLNEVRERYRAVDRERK